MYSTLRESRTRTSRPDLRAATTQRRLLRIPATEEALLPRRLTDEETFYRWAKSGLRYFQRTYRGEGRENKKRRRVLVTPSERCESVGSVVIADFLSFSGSKVRESDLCVYGSPSLSLFLCPSPDERGESECRSIGIERD